jgi:hypothetical protein
LAAMNFATAGERSTSIALGRATGASWDIGRPPYPSYPAAPLVLAALPLSVDSGIRGS